MSVRPNRRRSMARAYPVEYPTPARRPSHQKRCSRAGRPARRTSDEAVRSGNDARRAAATRRGAGRLGHRRGAGAGRLRGLQSDPVGHRSVRRRCHPGAAVVASPPVYAPAPVYVTPPAPVYVTPVRPVYATPVRPIYVTPPAPLYVAPPPPPVAYYPAPRVYYGPRYAYGRRHHGWDRRWHDD